MKFFLLFKTRLVLTTIVRNDNPDIILIKSLGTCRNKPDDYSIRKDRQKYLASKYTRIRPNKIFNQNFPT